MLLVFACVSTKHLDFFLHQVSSTRAYGTCSFSGSFAGLLKIVVSTVWFDFVLVAAVVAVS